jgi:hypothetical protein
MSSGKTLARAASIAERRFVSRVTAYQADTPMMGQHTLTLETSLPSSPAAKRVHPAGSATVPVAAAILSTIDGLGPSRSSGMADANDRWEDRVTIAALASAVVRTISVTSSHCSARSISPLAAIASVTAWKSVVPPNGVARNARRNRQRDTTGGTGGFSVAATACISSRVGHG